MYVPAPGAAACNNALFAKSAPGVIATPLSYTTIDVTTPTCTWNVNLLVFTQGGAMLYTVP